MTYRNVGVVTWSMGPPASGRLDFGSGRSFCQAGPAVRRRMRHQMRMRFFHDLPQRRRRDLVNGTAGLWPARLWKRSFLLPGGAGGPATHAASDEHAVLP